jgi:prepilin-type N-terminal cleavage/methylation domain-containing protein
MKDEKGLTLIELLVVLALISIVFSLLWNPLNFSFRNFDAQNEKRNIISDARFTMDYLTRQIRQAQEIEIKNDNIKMDSSIYKVDNRALFKDDKKIIEGIDDLNIDKADQCLNIEIVIIDSGGKDYRLSSTINIR